MNDLRKYIKEVLGEIIIINRLPENEMAKLPLYVSQTYNIYSTSLLGQKLVLVQIINVEDLSVSQSEKQLKKLNKLLNKKVVLVLDKIASYNRTRLINKRVNFIVPGKQLFLPEMLIDLREGYFSNITTIKKQNLLPSAQVIVLFHILNSNKNWDIDKKPFKEIAKKLNYSAMAISKAVNNLKELNLITTRGEKEKYIQFNYDKSELWNTIEEKGFGISPVFKQVYVDKIPPGIKTWHCNTSALSEYSDINRSKQDYLSIGKKTYNRLHKEHLLTNANPTEGRYCLEVWKYNPGVLAEQITTDNLIVDPLSLYLSLKTNPDERIEIALDQIKEKYIW